MANTTLTSVGDWTYTPSTTTGTAITYGPNDNVEWWNNSTVNTIITQQPKSFSLMNLDGDDMPESVFVNGTMVTLGIIGSNVQCSYMGNGQLLFDSGVIGDTWATGITCITISVVYSDRTCHYNIEFAQEVGIYKKGTKTLNAILVSTIPKK